MSKKGGCDLPVWLKTPIFATVMSARREKNKPRNTLNKQLEQPEVKPKKAGVGLR